ncbi:hypothetical protein FB471_4072 [Amycolatopsis cihanbeyliensis]|uniref:Secreted protein n=2 Tax=Amycolatopsis cihanbeyliensis TaxID=1128664 RepID=A0A542DMH4_AMYCI|nr:hypothetical protein FB471_4072 [Amycolatopsis cihanbeyliensis]
MTRVIVAVFAGLLLLAGCSGEESASPPPDSDPSTNVAQQTTPPPSDTTPSGEPTTTEAEPAEDAPECDPLAMLREKLDGRPWNGEYVDQDSALAHTTGGVTVHVGCGESRGSTTRSTGTAASGNARPAGHGHRFPVARGGDRVHPVR